MNQNLNIASFIKMKPIDTGKTVLVNVVHIVAIEEIGESLLRIRTNHHAYETHASVETLEQVLGRTAVVSGLS